MRGVDNTGRQEEGRRTSCRLPAPAGPPLRGRAHLRLPRPAPVERPASSGTQRLPRPSEARPCRAPAPATVALMVSPVPLGHPRPEGKYGRRPRQHRPQTRGRVRQAASPAPITSTSQSSLLPKERLATNRLYDHTARLSRPGSGSPRIPTSALPADCFHGLALMKQPAMPERPTRCQTGDPGQQGPGALRPTVPQRTRSSRRRELGRGHTSPAEPSDETPRLASTSTTISRRT